MTTYVQPTKTLYARPLVPFYIPRVDFDNKHGQYSPWIVAHEYEEQLSNEVLDERYRRWQETDADGEFSDFIKSLEANSYVVFRAETAGVWSPV